ncbi:hypothetical protein HPB48_023299 [Haemaphysalis longicornis]|uniref:Endonuclease/exonuclease/phosphatase domain-containing protein n=1 Tax=Haemaphysalis longicornis TaxID=44386 RepID=A0A9J6GW84_HAELO|nr:hypothetical protein HPB48_023299 [Haemaphysalis longicornis]
MEVTQEVAVYVRQGVPHCHVPTIEFGSDVQEVVAVRTSLGRQNVLVASAYVRPAVGGADFEWIRRLRSPYPNDMAVFGGDFNALSPT